MEFNATERRTLGLAAVLIVAGAAVRLAAAPRSGEFAWMPADSPDDVIGIEALRTQVRDAIERREESERPLAAGERIDPNTASVEQLDRLPGIGPVTAAAIVRYREANGAFRSAPELERVSGVGPSLSERLSGNLEFAAAPVSASPASGSDRVDVNRAQLAELQQITGIGPALARRIIQVRSRVGRYREAEDLLLVPGIGSAILAKIRDQVRFE